jgi:hypothetical protein
MLIKKQRARGLVKSKGYYKERELNKELIAYMLRDL